MGEKVTVMVLKVDLQCATCYKKVKKVLCKFPQIRNQIYDEKGNTVTITVVCCSPEKIRDKLCCKGAKAIQSIEIKEPTKPKPAPEKPPEKPEPKRDDDKSLPGKPPGDDRQKSAPAPTPVSVNFCVPVHGYPHMPMYPTGTCCGPCSEGYGGGPCYHGHERPVPPPPRPCYDGYGYEYGYGYRASKSCCVSSDYFSEENPQGCTLM